MYKFTGRKISGPSLSQTYIHVPRSIESSLQSNISLSSLEGWFFKQSQTDLPNGQDGTAHVTPGGCGTSPARQ